jgi:putative tryptophan/tyrosine transport system substrate-binding protein
MKAKILAYALPALILTTSHFAEAQQTGKVPRIGVLSPGFPGPSPLHDAFRQGLRELGYVEGQNIVIEYQYAEGKMDRLADLAAELVRLKVDVIVTSSTLAIQAAKQATKTVPIVMANVADPVAVGLVASLARPGGNITGLTNVAPDLGEKRLELLKEVIPKLIRVAVLWDAAAPGQKPQMKQMEVAADALGLQLQPLNARDPKDFDGAFRAATRDRAGALIGLASPLFSAHRAQIVGLALKSKLPAIYPTRDFADAGGLMSYGPNNPGQWRRAATYVDKILKGTKPADLPVEQPMKFELVINLKAAKQIGLTIPPNVLARADKVLKEASAKAGGK